MIAFNFQFSIFNFPLPIDLPQKKRYNVYIKTKAEDTVGQVYDFEREKLIVGVIYNDEKIYERAVAMLKAEFGEIDGESERFSFSREFSDYYDEELGGEGQRVIFSFRDTVDPARQSEIKQKTNEMEKELSRDGNRLINLDPGFINHGRLMLATTKKAGFRIPLSDGIYTELTLFWAKGAWHKLPWSYRDYQSERVQKFLTETRKRYLEQRKLCANGK